MIIFPNFKCPNGAPPEECIHIQQLAINFVNSLKNFKEAAARKQLIKDNQENKESVKSAKSDSTMNRQRTR